MTHPETCPGCGAPRTMIDEGRAFYKCGADSTGAKCVPGNGVTQTPRSVCAMCAGETNEEMELWIRRGGKIWLFLCPSCDQKMTSMAVRS